MAIGAAVVIAIVAVVAIKTAVVIVTIVAAVVVMDIVAIMVIIKAEVFKTVTNFLRRLCPFLTWEILSHSDPSCHS